MAPAERITSFLAVTVERLAIDERRQCEFEYYDAGRRIPFSLGANSTFIKVGFPPEGEVSTNFVTVFSMST